MPASAHQLLRVNSARDLGGPLDAVLDVRDAINSEKIPGPTMYVSGPFIQKEPYPGTEAFRWGVNGEKDAKAKVRKLAKAGVDCIKLIDQDQMSMDEIQAIVDEAHLNSLKVVAHSHRPDEIRLGLRLELIILNTQVHLTILPRRHNSNDKERTAKMNQGLYIGHPP